MTELGDKIRKGIKIVKEQQENDSSSHKNPTPYEQSASSFNKRLPKMGSNAQEAIKTEGVDKNRIYILITHWTFITAIVMGIIGVVLIFIGGPNGKTSFSFFGQSFESVHVGIGAIFIAAVVVVVNMQRLFKSVDRTRK